MNEHTSLDDAMEALITGVRKPNALVTRRSAHPKHPVTLIETDGRYLIQAPYAAKQELNDCEGALWNQTKQWEVPPTPLSALRIHQRFDVRNPSPQLSRLMEHGRRIALRIALPEDDGQQLTHLGANPAIPSWEHQRRARLWLEAMLAHPGSGAVLWYGVGTGKTRTTLDLIRTRAFQRVLVVVPKAAVPVWGKQAEINYPGVFNVVPLGGSSTKRKAEKAWDAILYGDSDKPTLIVTNYEVAWRPDFASVVKRGGFDLCVADEGHRLRGRNSKQSMFFRRAWRYIPNRLALTGTLIANGKLTDFFGTAAYLDPGLLGLSITRFEERFAWKHPDRPFVVQWRNVDQFMNLLWMLTQFQDRSVLDLPPVMEEERTFKLEGAAAAAYKEMRDTFVAELQEGLVTAANAGVKLIKLQQMTSGRVLDAAGRPLAVHNQKQELLEELMQETGEEPIVVFCKFREDLSQVRAAAARRGLSYGELSGNSNQLQEWQDGALTVLGVQVQSGSEAINLTRAAVAVFFSLTHSLLQNEQARGRVHRPGQERSTVFISLIAEGTVDRAIQAAVQDKKDLVNEILYYGKEYL